MKSLRFSAAPIRTFIEVLEARIAPATFYVAVTADYIVTTDIGAPGLSAGDTVTWDAGGPDSRFGTATGLVFGTDAFTSIQAAVNATSGVADILGAEDTVAIGRGTFSESVTVDKSVNIIGNSLSFGTTPDAQRTKISSASSALLISADNVRIRELTFTGNSVAQTSAVFVRDLTDNNVNNLTIENSRFEGNGHDFRMTAAVTGEFTGNVVNGSGDSVEFGSFSDHFTISGNTFSGDVNLDGGAGYTIEFNTFSNGTFTSLGGGSMSLDGNTFTGVSLSIAVDNRHTISGNVFNESTIAVTAPAQPNLGGFLEVKHNTFTANGAAVGITVNGLYFDDAPALIRGNVMHGFTAAAISVTGDSNVVASANELGTNTLAVQNLGTIPVLAKFAFFGPADAAGVAALVSGAVDTQSFVTVATDASGDPGWQPTISSPITFTKKNTATYVEGDGDTVTIKASKGRIDNDFFEFVVARNGTGLLLADFLTGGTGSILAGSNITVSVKKGVNGDGVTAIGNIDSNIALGAVKIPGDLSGLSAPNVGSLTAKSLGLGEEGTGFVSTQKLGKLTVSGLMLANVSASAPVGKKALGSAKVGAMAGELDLTSPSGQTRVGEFNIFGNSGKITVLGVMNGLGNAGGIRVFGNVSSIIVGGGVSADFRPEMVEVSGNIGTLKTGGFFGAIRAQNVKSLTINGDLQPRERAAIAVPGTVGTLTITGDLANGFSTLTGREAIDLGSVGTLTIKGSVKGGETERGISGIFVQKTIGTLSVGGDLGHDEGRVSVVVRDQGGTAKKAAIGKLIVGGALLNADVEVRSSNADASVGSVLVSGNWKNSNLVVNMNTGADLFFATPDDSAAHAPEDGVANVVSRIARVQINGTIEGGAVGTSSGITAPQIKALFFGKTKIPLTVGADNIALGTLGGVFANDLV